MEAGRKRGGEEEDPSERPVRRSRLVSEDAKLAMKLQLEEDKKAFRAAPPKAAAKRASAPPKPPPASEAPKAKKEARGGSARSAPHSPPAAQRGGRVGIGRGGKGAGQGQGRAKGKETAKPRAREGGSREGGKADRGWAGGREDSDLMAASLLVAAESKSHGGGDDPEGMVAFSLTPFENSLPAMRRGLSEQVWGEDQTVLQIKRHVVGEIWKGDGGDHSMLCLRTPSGLMLGNDHSLRYVRSVLWPPSQGRLNIIYSKVQRVGLL